MAYQPPADADTRYSYDTMGNLTAVLTTNTSNSQPLQEGSLSFTQMGYDGYGRKVSMTDPDMGTWTYKYNAAGSLTEQRDANLARLCFTYDSLDRLQYKRHDNDNDGCESSDTQLAFYDYYAVDAGGGYVGRLKEIQWSASGSTDRETFAYGTLGRLTSHTRIIYNRSYTMSYSSFDALHRPTTITYPNGQTSVTTFDREGPNTLANSGTNLISNIRFNGMGQMTTLQRSSGGIHTTYEYHPQTDVANGGLGDSNFRLKTIQHGAAGTGNAWPDFTYEYDKVGNISKMTTVSTAGTDTQSFGYDHLNRLISASASGVSPTYSHTYGYNKIGNLTNNGGVSQTYGSSSHVHALTNAGGVTYGYDNNGNMTFRNASGTVNDYTHTFNVENELVSVVNNGNTTTFAYDAAGIRVKTVAPNGTVTDYPFPGYEVESPTSNPTVRLTFSIAGQAVALKVMGSSTNTYYLYNDHLGSTSTMSTTAGGPVSGSTTRYYPFGDWRTEPTAGLTDRGFTGHLHNNLGNAPDDIGLVYMQARWYSPALGRFISADVLVPNPANPQAYNRYAYVRNSSLNRIDPTGHIDCKALGTESCDDNGAYIDPATPSEAPKLNTSCTDVWCTVARPSSIEDGTWNTYLTMANLVQGTEHLLSDGRFTDQYLIAMLIGSELKNLSGDAYWATLEALSNQYHDGICNGGCSSLAEQLQWLDSMESFRGRNGNPILIDNCSYCLGDAILAIEGYQDSYPERSWWWANPIRGSDLHDYVSENFAGTAIGGLIVDGNRFIVGTMGTPNSGTRHFVVMTQAQDVACNAFSGNVTCAGFPKSAIADISR